MDFNTITLNIVDRVAIITLNRPERLNAINRDMQNELEGAIAQTIKEEARVLLLTGSGTGFCSGADVTGMNLIDRQSTEDLSRPIRKATGWLTLALRRFPHPTIAAVNGVATGAGLSLALGCDIRVAAKSAKFSAIFVRRAIVPDYGCTYLLPKIVGMARALELMYTGNIIDAETALSIGLISRIVPDNAIMTRSFDLAKSIAMGPPITIELIKKTAYLSEENTLDNQMLFENHANSIVFRTEDYKEGVQSFLDKREPLFRGV